jgi:hypothetical protein
MNRRQHLSVLALVFFMITGTAGVVHAQATRTFVSGVGNDADPCSRTAPCKTFAGAISKTAAGGEINCLDPAGYGTVNITKSLVIDCGWTHGSLLASSTTGVIVNGAGINVILRGLAFNGAPPTLPGTHGVRFLNGNSLTIENAYIQNFTSAAAASGRGITFAPSGSARLIVRNTTIVNNGAGAAGAGIVIQPTGAAGNARVHLEDVRLYGNNADGLRVDTTGNTSAAGIVVDMENSQITGSTNGVVVITPVGTNSAIVNVNGSSIFNNPGSALSVNGANSIIRVGNNTITTNGFATSIVGGGTISSYGDNRTVGNSNPPAFTPPTLVRN